MVSVRSVRIDTLTDGGMEARSRGKQRLYAVGGFDDVGARLALDVQNDRRLVADPTGQADVLDVVDDFADVAEPHR